MRETGYASWCFEFLEEADCSIDQQLATAGCRSRADYFVIALRIR
jgi:hypothetical protein